MKITEIITENTQGVSEGTDDFSRNVATFRLYQHLDPMEFYNMARTPQGLAMLAKKAGTTPESVKDSLERLDWGQFPADFYQDDEEQGVAEGLDPYRLERLDPQSRRVLQRMADHAEPGSWLSASEAYAIMLGLQYKNRNPRGWEQEVQHYVDLWREITGKKS